MVIYFKESDWVKVRHCAAGDGVAAVPMGSLEQHGAHLPCGTDTYEIDEIMRRAATRIGDTLPVCICPTVEYSVVQWASPMASAGIAPFTLEQSLVDICHALTDVGFSKIVLLHGHGGLSCGRSALWQAMQEKRPALYVDFQPYERAWPQIEQIIGQPDEHAGMAETSMMLAVRPDLVDMSKAVRGPDDLFGEDFAFPSLKGPGSYPIVSVESTPDGLAGDATLATAEKGEKILDAVADVVAEILSELASKPTPPEFREVWRKDMP